jgi:hypothetical protein
MRCLLKVSVRVRKHVVIWGLVGFVVPICWGVESFISLDARESTWTDIYWYTVYISCPPWLLPENNWSWLLTPLLNSVLYAGVALLVSAVRGHLKNT